MWEVVYTILVAWDIRYLRQVGKQTDRQVLITELRHVKALVCERYCGGRYNEYAGFLEAGTQGSSGSVLTIKSNRSSPRRRVTVLEQIVSVP